MPTRHLRALSTDAASQLDVLWHDGDTLGVDGSQVGVFKQANEVSFGGFLKSTDSRGLEAQVGLEVLGDFTDETLEGQLADEQLGGFLVASDFTERNGAGSVSVGLLDSSSDGSRLAGSLGGELLAGSPAENEYKSKLT